MPQSDPQYPEITPPDASTWHAHAVVDEQVEQAPAPGASTAQLMSFRDKVQITDFRLIKRIGSGAYGEVWLAQSVTGAMRAVKIVWREDFELTKTFHREFLGIQQFEPISRGHPGLVHILHVGWNEEHGYYYCVMELADDAEASAEGEEGWKTYVPRTLATDMRRHGRLDLHFCQEAGAFIADALHYMHQRGLTHRDIKPSNIIYCDNVCKLADIGLVATFGERSFVGTEGFVPPEGPGTPQADIYSLGKVLYEMSSGKDRMEFPEVPGDLSETEWAFWKQFNRVICRACAPDLQERYQTAADFANALRAIADVEPPTQIAKVVRLMGRFVLLLVASCFAGAAWASYQHDVSWTYTVPVPPKPPPPKLYPTPGQPWQSIFGHWFSYKKDRHVADLPVDTTLFYQYVGESRPFEGGVTELKVKGYPTVNAVVVPSQDATDFCRWITERERNGGRLTDAFEYVWRPYRMPPSTNSSPPRQGWTAFICELAPVPYGKVIINTTPAPAVVYAGDVSLGNTPAILSKVRAGTFEYEVRYPGYKPEFVKGVLKKDETKTFSVKLKNISAVVFGKPWENTLKMKFVPLGRAMIGVTEVRRRDFLEYAKAMKLPDVPSRELSNTADLDKPVTFVTRSEAQSFCRWLTEKEQSTEILEGEHSYRLPTDDEWSMAANMPREKGDSPAERHLRIDGVYPWGYTWPPPQGPGNLFDRSAAEKAGKGVTGIPGYEDGFAGPAPVGSFRLDSKGLADLSGNVWEWVQEDFGGPDPAKGSFGTARGGAWTTKDRQELLASFRRALAADSQVQDVGFRVLLTDGHPARDED